MSNCQNLKVYSSEDIRDDTPTNKYFCEKQSFHEHRLMCASAASAHKDARTNATSAIHVSSAAHVLLRVLLRSVFMINLKSRTRNSWEPTESEPYMVIHNLIRVPSTRALFEWLQHLNAKIETISVSPVQQKGKIARLYPFSRIVIGTSSVS